MDSQCSRHTVTSQPVRTVAAIDNVKFHTQAMFLINFTISLHHHKARFSRLLRYPAWKRRGPTLVSALHKFDTYLLRHLPTYLQPRDPHGAQLITWGCIGRIYSLANHVDGIFILQSKLYQCQCHHHWCSTTSRQYQ